MNIKSRLRAAATSLLAALISGMTLCACDNAIYDGEGDCSVSYKVRFRYDYNMKYADAFAHEVSSVTLYLIDGSGNIVWQKTESGDALSVEGYTMDVDIEPGTYSMLAWCGTTDKGSFTIPSASVYTGLTCTLNRSYAGDGSGYIDTDIDRLYHGYVANQEFSDKPGTHEYTLSLVKNTNSIRVVLQQLSGESIDASKFTFTITDSNGKMDWDNNLIADEPLTYYAWHTGVGEAGVGDETSTGYEAVLAELTTARLVSGQDTRLTVTNNETGETVFSIPFIEYALMIKDFYNGDMTDQEFLDRQDEYDLVFFLSEGSVWMSSYIYINSWKVVLQDSNL
ncbi:MAG: FimB/Mfa2 family fimbrial subunit [Prevotella sp.]|nr:FimB/Mfa2 family fimbrial subunit [Prevotella sp.]